MKDVVELQLWQFCLIYLLLIIVALIMNTNKKLKAEYALSR